MTNTQTQINIAATAEAIAAAAEAIAGAAHALPYDQQLEAAIVRAKAARQAAEDAKEHHESCRQDVLDLMVQSDLASFDCAFGKVTVCKGRRTVSVVDKKLSAKITAMKEKGVYTGRCTEKIGADYVTIK